MDWDLAAAPRVTALEAPRALPAAAARSTTARPWSNSSTRRAPRRARRSSRAARSSTRSRSVGSGAASRASRRRRRRRRRRPRDAAAAAAAEARARERSEAKRARRSAARPRSTRRSTASRRPRASTCRGPTTAPPGSSGATGRSPRRCGAARTPPWSGTAWPPAATRRGAARPSRRAPREARGSAAQVAESRSGHPTAPRRRRSGENGRRLWLQQRQLGPALAARFPATHFVGLDIKPRGALLLDAPRPPGARNVAALALDIDAYDGPCDLVISLHACGGATDSALALAARSRAPFAVSPCCIGKIGNAGRANPSWAEKLDWRGGTGGAKSAWLAGQLAQAVGGFADYGAIAAAADQSEKAPKLSLGAAADDRAVLVNLRRVRRAKTVIEAHRLSPPPRPPRPASAGSSTWAATPWRQLSRRATAASPRRPLPPPWPRPRA